MVFSAAEYQVLALRTALIPLVLLLHCRVDQPDPADTSIWHFLVEIGFDGVKE